MAGAGAAVVRDVMVRAPKTLPASATVSDVLEQFVDDHVHMVLLSDGARLVGAVLREDVSSVDRDAPAVDHASIQGRVIDPDAGAERVRRWMLATARRRLAVVAGDDELLGLLCLKRHGRGFCSDEDVASRARENAC